MYDVQKFEGIDIRADENFLDFGQPLVHLIVILAYVAVLLVCPMCSDTFLRDVIHPLRPDLNLDPDARLAHKSTVKRLVAIALWMLDPVPHAVRLVSVKSCNYGEYVIALVTFSFIDIDRNRIENYPYRIEVIDLFEGNLLGNHLVPDGIRSLYPLLYLEIESRLLQCLPDRFDELVNALFLVGHVPVDLGADFIVRVRFLIPQPDVLHL